MRDHNTRLRIYLRVYEDVHEKEDQVRGSSNGVRERETINGR